MVFLSNRKFVRRKRKPKCKGEDKGTKKARGQQTVLVARCVCAEERDTKDQRRARLARDRQETHSSGTREEREGRDVPFLSGRGGAGWG